MNGPVGQETRSGSENLPEKARDVERETEQEIGTASSPRAVSNPVESADSVVRDQLDGSPVLAEVFGDALPKLEAFHVKLAEEGEPRGLIGPRDVDIIWERHILNSAAIVPFVREATEGEQFKTVADVGSGGGFPGLVAAACLPDHRFTLIEPMERRVEWLRECIETMGLENVTVLRARSEEVIAKLRSTKGMHPYAVVTCRAVAPMTKLAGWTLPLLKPQGRLVALKGRSAQAEIDKAAKEIAKRGGRHPRVCEAPVGPGLEPTHVVLVDKR